MSTHTPPSSQDQFANKAMAWSARFSEPVSDLVKRYTASVDFDKRMARFDIQGSLAHASMLAAVGVITEQDKADIERGMSQILDEIAQGQFQWLLDLEDVHLNIEKRLVELIGDAGKRLHTGRSRNDQVATDIRRGCAMKSTLPWTCWPRCSASWLNWHWLRQTLFCPVSPTCKWHSPLLLATICWLTPKCSSAMPSVCKTAANA